MNHNGHRGYYFDRDMGRFRIHVSVQRDGRHVRRSKTLPASATEVDARMLADSMRAGLLLELAGINTPRAWEQNVLRAYATRGSWLHEMFARARARGKKKGVGCSLSLEDLRDMCIKTGGRCEVSGVAFSEERFGEAKMRPFVPSIDRRNPSLGYGTDNCRIVCACINVAMFSWGEEAFKSVAVGYVINQFLGDYAGLVHAKRMPTVAKCQAPGSAPKSLIT